MSQLLSAVVVAAVAVVATLFVTGRLTDLAPVTGAGAGTGASTRVASASTAGTCGCTNGGVGEEWDFVVVGGGTAGCVVAGRLAEADPSYRVLVLERGDDVIDEPMVQPPSWNAVFSPLLSDPVGYPVEGHPIGVPIKAAGFFTEYVPRVMGGGPQISGSFWGRGDPSNYDDWAAAVGDADWSFASLESVFARSEDFKTIFNPELTPSIDPSRGRTGPIKVALLNASDARIAPFAASLAASMGTSVGTDYNTPKGTTGVFPLQRTFGHNPKAKPVRSSTWSEYLKPLLDARAPNVKLYTHAAVTRVVFDRDATQTGEPRATAVEYVKDGISSCACISARGEVVLSAGAYGDPKVLQLSGVGPIDVLKQHGIPVVLNLPGVGDNLQDHMAIPFRYALNASLFPSGRAPGDNGYPPSVYTLKEVRPAQVPESVLKEDTTPFLSFYQTAQNPKGKPDMEVLFSLTDCNGAVCLAGSFLALHNEARGTVQLFSGDPAAPPVIGFYWPSPELLLRDQRRFGELLERLRVAFLDAMPPGTVLAETLPGLAAAPRKATDGGMAAAISAYMFGYHHPASTCKMGRRDDPTAVVDSRLRVIGLANVRVADNAVQPRVVTQHPSATATVIGERAAEYIVQRLKTDAKANAKAKPNA